MRRFFHQPALRGSVFRVFFSIKPERFVGNEPNLDWFQRMYRWSNDENFGSVCLIVREKISSQTDRQTDGHGEYIG